MKKVKTDPCHHRHYPSRSLIPEHFGLCDHRPYRDDAPVSGIHSGDCYHSCASLGILLHLQTDQEECKGSDG